MHPGPSISAEQLDDLLQRCVAAAPDERAKIIEQACAGDAQLQRVIVERLALHDQTQSWPPASRSDSASRSPDAKATPGTPPTVSLDSGSTRDAPHRWNSLDDDATALEPIPPSLSADARPTRIGPYEILSEIARGGMGVVFKARDAKLQRLVAIKIPRAAQLEEEGEARFLREARAAARLHHPNICPIYEVGQAGGQPFIALGFVDGPTLKEWAKREKPNARQAAELMTKVARAVDHAHQHDVLHRDIKPSNIMLEAATGEPVLMDFGLAKQLSETESEFTRSGQILGTPVYMAPEQAAGQLERIGAATDVYALGAVLYELLTGHAPFAGALGEVLRKVQCEQPPTPRSLAPSVHRDLETICLKAMAKEPAARYASASALADDLQRFAAGEAILARREGLLARARRLGVRHWRGLALAASLAIVALGIVSYAISGAQQTRRTAALVRQFDIELETATASPADRQQLESLLTELAQQDAPEAERLRAQMHSAFAQQVLQKSRIEPDDVKQFNRELAWLQQHAPTAAVALQEQFQRRLRTWQSKFRLTAPWQDWQKILPEDVIEARADQLARRSLGTTPTPAGSRVLTSVPSRGYARLVAVFADGWQQSEEVGLLIHATQRRGYEFRLRPAATGALATDESVTPAVAPLTSVTFADTLASQGNFSVSILREGHVLRTMTLRPADIGRDEGGQLRLEALVEGSRIEFKIGSAAAVRFDDIFGHVAEPQSRFGLVWPETAELVSLEAFSQALPIAPSPLEEGDELFVNGRWDAALDKYRAQAALAGDARQIAQAQFKAALCLVQLRRPAEAHDLLEQLSAADDEHVRLLAACQLWLLAAREKNYDEAQIIFENLQSRYSFEELAFLVPEEDRRRIVDSIYAATTGLNLFRFDEQDLAFLRRSHAVARLLDQHASIETRNIRTWQLVRACHMCGQLNAGIQTAAEYLAQFHGSPVGCPLNMVEELSWMLRQQNRHAEAAEWLDLFLKHPESVRRGSRELLVERARLYAVQRRFSEAAKVLDDFLNDPRSRGDYRSYSHACLVRGFLHEQAGEADAAAAAWRRGNFHQWVAELPESSQRGVLLNGMGAVSALLLAALTGELTDAHFQEIYASPLSSAWGGATGALFQQYVPLVASAARGIAGDEFGREKIRRLAYRDCPLTEFTRDPLALIFLELSRQGAAPERWTDEERDLIWQFVHAAYEDYQNKKIGNAQAVQFLLTWKGSNNIFGWQGLATALPPSVRGRAAYMFGHRFERLGKPDDARKFFRTALDDAEPDSPLARLAKTQLDRLAK